MSSEIALSHIIGHNTSVRPSTAQNGSNSGTDDGDDEQRHVPRLSDLSTGECVAYGRSARTHRHVRMHTTTEKANKAKEGERDAPILDDGRATTICYVPIIWHDYAEACVPTLPL